MPPLTLDSLSIPLHLPVTKINLLFFFLTQLCSFINVHKEKLLESLAPSLFSHGPVREQKRKRGGEIQRREGTEAMCAQFYSCTAPDIL